MRPSTSLVDIRSDHLETVQKILRSHLPDGVEVCVFGSRANWTTTDSSDLDLAVAGPAKLDYQVIADLEIAFEESNLPYSVDVVDLNAVSEDFKRIVDQQKVSLPLLPQESNWTKVPLSKVIELRLSSVDKKSKNNERGIQLCNYMDVYNNTFIHRAMEFMDATATEKEIANCSLFEGDVVITKDSEKHDDIGVPALVRENISDLVCGYHLAILRPSSSELDGTFLFYALSTGEVQRQFHSYANGITRFGLRKADIGLVEIPFPPLDEQRAIAHILGTLDDKIELNRRMNQTLEEMARAIYKDWFVDFGPTRAKLEGREPYLPPELWDLFPECLVESELGEIPEGWKVGVLDDVIEILSGGTPKTSIPEYWDGTIPWYTPKDAPSLNDIFAITTERHITPAGVNNSSTKILPAGTTVISARGTVGRLACLGIPMAMNQTCYGIQGSSGYPNYFTYWNIRSAVNALQARTHGTIFDTITRDTFKIAESLLVSTNMAKAFESTVAPLMERLLMRLNESFVLSAERNALLPKLLSGELKVK